MNPASGTNPQYWAVDGQLLATGVSTGTESFIIDLATSHLTGPPATIATIAQSRGVPTVYHPQSNSYFFDCTRVDDLIAISFVFGDKTFEICGQYLTVPVRDPTIIYSLLVGLSNQERSRLGLSPNPFVLLTNPPNQLCALALTGNQKFSYIILFATKTFFQFIIQQ